MAEQESHAGHKHGSSGSRPSNNSAFAIGISLNVAFVIIELIFGFASHSLALLSDAGHNLSDVLGLILAWAAIYAGRTLPTKRRTYGLRRSSILAALGNALILLVAVGGISWEALQRFGNPESVSGTTVMWVAGIGVIVNAATALLFMAGRKSDLNIKGAFLHMAADAGVSLGVVASGFLIHLTHWYWLDAIISMVVALVIIWGTWGLLRESINLAMDAVPEGIDLPGVESYLSGLPGVASVHDLHIWGMSTTEAALTAHLVMPAPPTNDAFINGIQHHLQDSFSIGHATLQIEYGSTDFACHQNKINAV